MKYVWQSILVCLLFIVFLEVKAGKVYKSNSLEEGDMIFWVNKNKTDTAGHVAVINKIPSGFDKIKIAHSTDHPLYNAFVTTHLSPSSKIAKHGKKYMIFRIRSHSLRKEFIKLLNIWLSSDIPFDKSNELKMNKWDDSLLSFATSEKILLQKHMFELKKLYFKEPYKIPTTAMCTEIILKALHNIFFTHSNNIPNSLYLLPDLCPPSLMFAAIANDTISFINIGDLEVYNT